MASCSYSFIFRARCKHCAGTPTQYYLALDKFTPKDIKYFLNLKHSFFKKDFSYKKDYISFSRKFGSSINTLSAAFSSIDVSYHKNYNIFSEQKIKEIFVCKCRKTVWAKTELDNTFRRHISNRKCKYGSPIKINF